MTEINFLNRLTRPTLVYLKNYHSNWNKDDATSIPKKDTNKRKVSGSLSTKSIPLKLQVNLKLNSVWLLKKHTDVYLRDKSPVRVSDGKGSIISRAGHVLQVPPPGSVKSENGNQKQKNVWNNLESE